MFGYRTFITIIFIFFLCHFGEGQKKGKKKAGKIPLKGFNKFVIRLHILDTEDNSTTYASATALSGISMITAKSVLPRQYTEEYSDSDDAEDWYEMRFAHQESGGLLDVEFGDTVVHPKTDLTIIRTKSSFLAGHDKISAIVYNKGSVVIGERAFLVGDEYFRESRFAVTTTTTPTTSKTTIISTRPTRTTTPYPSDSCESYIYYCSSETRTHPPETSEETVTTTTTKMTKSTKTYRTPITTTRKSLTLLRRRPVENIVTISACPRTTKEDMFCSYTHNITLPNEEDAGGPLVTKEGELIGVISRQRYVTFTSTIVYFVDVTNYRKWITDSIRVRKKKKKRRTTTTKKKRFFYRTRSIKYS